MNYKLEKIKMKLTYSKIFELANKAVAHPKWNMKKEAVESISGCSSLEINNIVSEEQMINAMNKDYQAVIILCTPDDLLGHGTVCGGVPNFCFNQKVIDYLNSKKVTEIFCAVVYDESCGFLISGAEINISGKFAGKLYNLIGEAHGSWRNDVGTEKGWSSFESE